ncbi:MAG: fibronectin type III domain-containing protein [bacterium]|nr:fibronectin type III domain-containing protein [bacterium]
MCYISKLKCFLALLVMVAVVTGCSRHLESSDPVRTLPESTVVPSNVRVALGNNSLKISWDISEAANVSGFRLFLFDSSLVGETGTAIPLETFETSAREIRIPDLIANKLYFIQVAALFESGLEGLRSSAISARPTYFSLSIENGAEYVNDSIVDVHISTPLSATHMRLSEDSLFDGVQYESFEEDTRFEFSPGDGVKHLYLDLQFTDGSVSDQIASDSISVDTDISIDQVVFSSGVASIQTGDTVLFSLFSMDPGGFASVSFGSITNMELFDDGTHGDAAPLNGIYTAFFVVPPGFSLNNEVVRGTFTDQAGNRLTKAADERLTVYAVPDPVTLAAVAISDSSVYLHWTESTSSDFIAYRIYRSATANADENSTFVAAELDRQTVSYTEEGLAAATEYYYVIYVYDQFGFKVGSQVVMVQTLATPSPQAP